MPHLEQITIAPRLTFDALAAGKPGARWGCWCTMRWLSSERRAAAIAASPC